MKELLNKTSTTSIVAIILIVACMSMMFFITGTGAPKDDTTRTQIVQGLFGLLSAVVGYYFGASKTKGAAINADTANTVITEEKP